MSMRLASDFADLSLSDGGRALIEASAGTGKTWTISVLYLRLLLERELAARQIAVATYTNAAADELRARLRARLRWAVRLAGVDGTASVLAGDPDVVDWLHRRWQHAPAARAADVTRMEQALGVLDQAPIGTLHSLCQRILVDHPLLAGADLAPRELVDGRAASKAVADDLWRHLQQGEPAHELREWVDEMQRSSFTALVLNLLQPGVAIEHATPPPILDATHADLLVRLANDDAVLAKNARLRRGWPALAAWLRAQRWPLPDGLLDDLDALDGDRAVRRGALGDPDVQRGVEFSRACLAELRRHARRLPRQSAAVLESLRAQATRALHTRFARSRQLGFDSLIADVHALLHDASTATALADALYAAWPATMVDEFQDTDPLQYGILDRIYRDSSGTMRGRLLLIGDPKQAIYRFRGGDIHTYQRAAAAVQERLSLDVNQRSTSALVAACNAFYADCGAQFAAHEDASVNYQPMRAAGRRDAPAYTIDALPVPTPLHVHLLTPAPEGGVSVWRTLALQACADHIATLLRDERHRIGERRLQPADIAVLVPKNEQVDQLHSLLCARAVPCIASSRASVFAGEAARSLHIILHAVVHCDDLGLLRAALASRPFGSDYAALHALGDSPERWQPWLQRFRAWQHLWDTVGVQAVVAELIESIAADALACVDGERLLTDLRHLGELLQEASGHRAGAQDLLAWLAQQRGGSAEGDAAEAAQLRIESDAQRVRVMTVHASKGLEFNLVFLPLMWDQVPRKEKAQCLLSTSVGRLLASSPEAIERDLREQQDEGFRRLYVALTRAVHACHLYALDPARAANVPQLLDGEPVYSALDVMLRRRTPTPSLVFTDGWPLARAAFDVRAAPIDAQSAIAPCVRSARPMPAPPSAPLPGRYSFSALVGGMHASDPDAEAVARDESIAACVLDELAQRVEEAAPAHPQLLALAGMTGTDFGNAVHAILELRDPALPLTAQTDFVRTQLWVNGVRDPERTPEVAARAVGERLQAVLDTPLDGAAGPCLARLPADAMRAEMAFAFRLDGTSLMDLRATLRALGEPDLVPAHGECLLGLMSGKIDLVFAHAGRFHVLDYKSNWLGDRLAAYTGSALQAAMDASGYRFQALLYTLALERYLRQRLPAYARALHLGESWYLFVRAVGLAPGTGVWRHRFADAVLDAAQAAFALEARA